MDIDQLGICYPERSDDPGLHQLQVANLAAVIDNYQAAGARCVVVSGVVDAERGVTSDQLLGVVITWCRHRADRTRLTQRLQQRGDVQYDMDDVWREVELLDRSALTDAVVVDTTDLGLDAVVGTVHQRTAGWPDVAATEPARTITPLTLPDETCSGGTILWLCGPTGVGKSAVGFQVFMRLLNAGTAAAFVDLDQIGSIGPGADDGWIRRSLKAANLAAIWRNYVGAGATHLVVVGPAAARSDIDQYIQALPAKDATEVVLRHAEWPTARSQASTT